MLLAGSIATEATSMILTVAMPFLPLLTVGAIFWIVVRGRVR